MSKFAAVLAAKRDQEAPAEETTSPTPEQEPEKAVRPQAASKRSAKANGTMAPVSGAQSELKRRGRPNAKRSDPNFVQTTAYIRKKTHKDVKRALLAMDSEAEMDFSELVENLLTDWLKKQN